MSPTLPAATPASHRFLMLDLLRGIAAISVLVYHTHQANYLDVQLLPNAYLAVDMFFLLSGFVIAHNYDGKIRSGMSLTAFLSQRLIRLYPCLLLTLLLGILVTCLRMVRYEGFLDGWRILAAAGLNALFVPAVIQPYGTWGYFPFNGAAWSLTFELIANIFYWLTFRQLNGVRLGLLILGAAIAMIIGANLMGTMDVGMIPSSFWWGIPRVALTFFIGVALRRYFHERVTFDLRGAAAPVALLCLMLAFSLSRIVIPELKLAAELVTIGLLFPLLLLIVGGATPGPKTAKICKWTGDASYPVYLLQTPFMAIFAAIPQILWGMKAAYFIPWIGIAYITGTILCSLWIDRYFELPLRRLLKERWQRHRNSLASPTASRSATLP
jgi:peptidoglycan/LPS O-acetylase OafA/YrhL